MTTITNSKSSRLMVENTRLGDRVSASKVPVLSKKHEKRVRVVGVKPAISRRTLLNPNEGEPRTILVSPGERINWRRRARKAEDLKKKLSKNNS